MNCNICFEDNINDKDIHYMECFHYLCDKCFLLLTNNSCPFCRSEITLCNKKYDSDNEEEFCFFRKNRQEYLRNKKEKKKQRLQRLLDDELYFFEEQERKKSKHFISNSTTHILSSI